jgi:hypothetical protein
VVETRHAVERIDVLGNLYRNDTLADLGTQRPVQTERRRVYRNAGLTVPVELGRERGDCRIVP